MKTMTLSLALLLAPSALFAQAGGQAQVTGSAAAKARGPDVAAAAKVDAGAAVEYHAPKGFSAEGAAKLDAMYAEAREHHVPREPMATRVAEGEAKGASETAILASAGKVKAHLETAHDAMVAAGRTQPSDQECARGASALERGFTRVQIEALVKHTPSDRSLVVAFDVLTQLAARGVPVTQALAEVQAKIDDRASDDAITALVATANGGAGASAAGATSAHAATGAKAATGGVTGSVTGTVTGTVGGVV